MNDTNNEINKEEVLIYNPKEEVDNIRIDYRNSNFKQIIMKFEEINLEITLIQDFKFGKGGIVWDGVKIMIS